MEVNIPLNHVILNLIAEIDEFKGAWAAYQKISPDTLALMRHVATIASVGSSTRIEGVKLSDAEIEALLAGLSTESFATRDEQEVAGYAEAVNLIFDAYETIPLNENYICQLHQILLKFSSKDIRHRGNYKKHPNHVEAFDENGRSLGIIFETASAFDTPLKMHELVEWLQTTLDNKSLHPLLAIAAFVVMFLAIHPFQDGNGRLSRVLTLLLLLQSGYGYVPYSSLEQIIENNKDAYYRALRLTQKTLVNEQPDWLPWLSFFLETLLKQKQRLEVRLQQEQRFVKQALSTLEEQMMEIFKTRGKVTIAELVTLTQSRRNTLKSSLKKLVNLQLIKLHGKGRGAFYRQTSQ
jgi:Fic family protein